jgi:hypothetical protein
MVYTMLHPDYGYGLVALENHLPSAPGDNELGALYDYNFLSPHLVEKLGRDRILSVTTWRMTPFDDGGVLLEMSPNPLFDRKITRPNYQQAADILGLPQFYQGGLT